MTPRIMSSFSTLPGWTLVKEIVPDKDTISINQIKDLIHALTLKTSQSQRHLFVIRDGDLMTLPAQNCLLKTLEECADNNLIIIVTSNANKLLPTILSRCKIIDLKEKETPTANEDVEKLDNVLDTIFNGNIATKLKIAQDIVQDTEEASIWLEKISIFVRSKLVTNYSNPKYLELLRRLQDAYKNIKNTNVSKRVALENLFLSF